MTTATMTSRPISYWLIAIFALLWNLLGVGAFLMQLLATPEQLAMMPPEQRQLHDATPAWLQVPYALAVFGGVLGAIGLLAKKRWATGFFLLSLVALVVQVLGTFIATPAWTVLGPAALTMPVVLLAIALFLLWYSRRAAARGWLG
ncbi:hypothetical protein [Lysobacter changpingensis]|uniref:hypothetical protein n=1 Tax=Lysobacter changpingensis TaxID=2792784 RepID=UPI001A8F2E90|nr:hypothetical protein [Lysobacter changpingensis]